MLVIFSKDLSQFGFDCQWKSGFNLWRDFFAPLTMTVCNWEEMTVFQTAKVRNRDPCILVLFMRIARRLTSFCCESKFCDAVGVHLLWIACVVWVLHICQLTLRQRMHDFLNHIGAWWYFLWLSCSIRRQNERPLRIVSRGVTLSLFKFCVSLRWVNLFDIWKLTYSSFT